MNIIVRQATSEDADIIATFNQQMALETEGKSLVQDVIQSGVRRMLEDSNLGFYLVAEIDRQTVGCLGVTGEWSDWRNGLFWWIQSVYVAPESRTGGVFSAMYQEVYSRARENADVCGLRLYAEKANENAISTYKRLGMIVTDYRLMEVLF